GNKRAVATSTSIRRRRRTTLRCSRAETRLSQRSIARRARPVTLDQVMSFRRFILAGAAAGFRCRFGFLGRVSCQAQRSQPSRFGGIGGTLLVQLLLDECVQIG